MKIFNFYFFRKGYPALNCQVVIDADGKFRDVVAKYPGSCHDAFVFSNSALKQTLEYNPSAGFLFADSGYGLSPVLITPFNQPTTPEEIYFNKVHRQVRSDVERAIGRLKNHGGVCTKVVEHFSTPQQHAAKYFLVAFYWKTFAFP